MISISLLVIGLSVFSNSSRPVPPSKPPPGRMGPGGIRGRQEIRRGRWEGPSRKSGAAEKELGGRLPHPLGLGKPAGVRGEVPHPLRSEVGAHLGPFCSVEPKLHPPQPPGPFPALWVLNTGLSTTQISPLLRPCPPQPRPFTPFFFFSFFLFPPLFYYCGTVVPSSC